MQSNTSTATRFEVAVNALTCREKSIVALNSAVALNFPVEDSMEAVVGKPEFTENIAYVHCKVAQST